MRTGKELQFSKKHFTSKEKEAKAKAKASTTPSTPLQAPDLIKGNILYAKRWRSTMKLYAGTDLLNALDMDLLARYCIESVELERLIAIREDYYNRLEKARQEEGEDPFGWSDTLKDINMRIDGKLKTLQSMALNLYMTPRARAGTVPIKADAPKADPGAEMFGDGG